MTNCFTQYGSAYDLACNSPEESDLVGQLEASAASKPTKEQMSSIVSQVGDGGWTGWGGWMGDGRGMDGMGRMPGR